MEHLLEIIERKGIDNNGIGVNSFFFLATYFDGSVGRYNHNFLSYAKHFYFYKHSFTITIFLSSCSK